MKFVHAADVHLDSPMRGLSRYEGAPVDEMRAATRKALANLTDLATDEDAAFVLLAGDLFDGNWKDYNTGLFFAAQMTRLRAAGIRVGLIRGNHDAQSQITKNLKWPSTVHEFSTKRPETVVWEDLGVALHGQGFASRAVMDDLASSYPTPVAGALNIGLLHTSAWGREGHEPYAPCSLATLENKGYDYWALGHVHAREVLSDKPWVVFPGNTQGRHAKEAGPKGATLVTVTGNEITSVEHRTLDAARWVVEHVDVSEAKSLDDVVDLVRRAIELQVRGADGRTLAARVVLVGQTRAHAAIAADPERTVNDIRVAAADVATDGIWVEKVQMQTRLALDLREMADRDDAIGQLMKTIAGIKRDPESMQALLGEFKDLRAKLPSELKDGLDAIRLEDAGEIAPLLDDVEQILLPRLLYKDVVP